MLADRDVGKDGCAGADGGPFFHQRRLDDPVTLGLQLTVRRGRARTGVVNERDTMANEDVVLDGDPFADEGMAGDLAVLADRGVFLNVEHGADLGDGSHYTD